MPPRAPLRPRPGAGMLRSFRRRGTTMRLPLVLVLALACSAAHRADAAASYDACTGFIDTLPATIGTQGTWCLRNNLTSSLASGAAISIATNNVVLDCNGFKIGGLSAGPT